MIFRMLGRPPARLHRGTAVGPATPAALYSCGEVSPHYLNSEEYEAGVKGISVAAPPH